MKFQHHLTIFFAYLLIAAIALNRLVFNLGDLVPVGPLNDYHLFTWNYWWIDKALFDLHTDPYFTNYILFPQVHNLAAHTLTPILYPFHRALYPLFGNPASLNLILWLSFGLAGYTAFLFFRRFVGGAVFPLIGGLLFAFSPAMLDHAINYHANMWLMCWIPASLLVWDRVARTRRILWAAIFGVMLWAILLTDPQFFIWLPFLLVPYGLLTLVRAASRRYRKHLILLGMLSVVIFLVLSCIAPLPALLRGGLGGTSPARYLTAQAYSLPPSGLIFAAGNTSHGDRSVGRLVPALALVALVCTFSNGHQARSQVTSRKSASLIPGRWFWLVIAIPPLILSLGPDLDVGGVPIPLPYRVLHDALGGLYRFPSRFAPLGILALLVFVGLSLRPYLRRTVIRYLFTGVTILFVVLDAGLFTPFPVQKPLPDYVLYHTIATQPGDFVILDVPVTVHSGWLQVGGGEGQRAMWYQTIHGKRQVNGSISRIPDIDHVYFQQNPLLGWFSDSHDADVPAASAELTRLVRDWPIGYVLVHLNWLDPPTSLPILGFLNTHPGLCFYAQERDLIAYRAVQSGCPAPGETLEIDFGAMGDEPYLVRGWYPRENIGGPVARWARQEVQLRVRLFPGRDHILDFEALGFGPDQTVSVRVNDTQIGQVDLPNAWTTNTLGIPASFVPPDGDVLITFAAARETQPGSADTRLLAAAYRWLRIR